MRPLHGGRHSIAPEVLAHNQRERLLAAVASTVAAKGYNATTIDDLAETAAVSKRTFYQHFASKEECFLAAYEALDDFLARLVQDAAEGPEEWAEQVAAAFAALIGFLASRPNLARLYLVEAAVVGEALSAARERTADRFVSLLEAGRKEGGAGGSAIAEGVEEGIVGGILTLLGRRVMAGEAEQLERFIPAVIEFGLAPYLGPDGARAIAKRHA